jgi:hypothetical protein
MTDTPTFYDDIEGYPSELSYRLGDTVDLHVSCKTSAFSVVVERWGAERVKVLEFNDLPGSFTPPPEDADAKGCDWPSSLRFPVGEDWASGFYLVTFTATDAPADRAVAHAGFVVRPAQRTAKALLVLATNTWNAYNNWGGASLYTGGTQVSFRRPFGRGMLCRPEVERDDRKARPARWGEEVDADGQIFQDYRMANGYPPAIGSSGWFTFERRFVEWAEGAGFELDYAISTDLEAGVESLDGYDLVLGVGHDEYWSARQRNAVEAYVADGGDYASFSGNTMFWQVRVEPTTDGNTMICHKYAAHESDPVVADGSPELMSGMWCDPVVGRPEWTLLGGGSAWGLYYRFGAAVARGSGGFTVYRDSHWLLAGTGLRYGDQLGSKHGAVGYETLGCRIQFDNHQLPVAAPLDGMPSDVEIVAFTPASNIGMGEYPKSISALSDQGDLEFIASRLFGRIDDDSLSRVRHGNAVMLVCRPFGAGGGEVVTVGTTDWAFGLADDDGVAQVTKNVLDRFLS